MPFPKKFFSVIPPPIVEPLVPTPAANEISPVGCSSTVISTIFKLLVEPSVIDVSTFLKISSSLYALGGQKHQKLFLPSPALLDPLQNRLHDQVAGRYLKKSGIEKKSK